jgi:GntR family transcriptional regulator
MIGIEQERIDRRSPQKLYHQLKEILRSKLERGEWAVGIQIPTEEELCQVYEVSKATVRQAVSDLVREGFLQRRQGRGTFVCPRVIPEGLAMLTSFRELMLDAGVFFTTRVLARAEVPVTEDLALKLDIPEDRTLLHIRRLRLVGEEPVLLQDSWLPQTLCPRLLAADLEQDSVIDTLERQCHVTITRVRDVIEAVPAGEEGAALLQMAPGAPCLLLEQYFYAGERQVMFARSLKRPERFRFVLDLERRR